MEILKWLKSQEIIRYSPFTADWVERMIWECEDANLMGTSEATVKQSIKREVENILQVLNPRLLDMEFFKQVLKEVS